MDVVVVKREGEEEAWNEDKIVTSMIRSGANGDEAMKATEKVKEWIQSNSNGKVSSIELRDKIIEELHSVNPVASETYRVYKKSS